MITIAALFTRNNGQPATGLALASVDLYLYRRTKATGATAILWNPQNPTEEIGGGLYTRAYTGEDTETYTYFAYGAYTGVVVLDSNYATMGAPQCEVLDDAVEGNYTLRQLQRIMAAALAGESTGGATATIRFRDVNDTRARIVATVDYKGNRQSVTLDGTK